MAYKKKVVKKTGGSSTPLQSAMQSGAFGLVGMLPGMLGIGPGGLLSGKGGSSPKKKVTIKKKK